VIEIRANEFLKLVLRQKICEAPAFLNEIHLESVKYGKKQAFFVSENLYKYSMVNLK